MKKILLTISMVAFMMLNLTAAKNLATIEGMHGQTEVSNLYINKPTTVAVTMSGQSCGTGSKGPFSIESVVWWAESTQGQQDLIDASQVTMQASLNDQPIPLVREQYKTYWYPAAPFTYNPTDTVKVTISNIVVRHPENVGFKVVLAQAGSGNQCLSYGGFNASGELDPSFTFTNQPVVPTATPTPTPTPKPTSTPTPTVTPQPTATIAPTAAPAPTNTPTPEHCRKRKCR